MSGIKTILNRARRRIVLNTAIRRSGIGLLMSALIGLIIVIAVRVSGADLPWQVFPALCLAGLFAGLLHSILTAPPSSKVAIQLDNYLGLKDRIGTAEAIRLGEVINADTSFAELAKRDANRIAENLNVKAASPIVFSGAWGGALAATIVLCLTVLLLPPAAWSNPSEPLLTSDELAELDENRNEAADTVDELLEKLQQDPVDPASSKDFKILDELAEQFRNKKMKPDEFAESRDKTTDKLNEVADKFARQAERDQQILDEVVEQFTELENKEGAESSPMTSELTEALKQGDYDRAAEIADKMDEKLGNMSEAERKKLADSLREMSDQLESAKEQSESDAQSKEEEIRNDLRDQGLDEETIDDLVDKAVEENSEQPKSESEAEQASSTEEIEQQLKDEGVDSEVAEKLAEEIQKNKEESEANREANETSEEISEALDEAADEAEDKAEEKQDTPKENEEQQKEEARQSREDSDNSKDDQKQSEESEEQSNKQQGNKPTKQQQKSKEDNKQDVREESRERTGDQKPTDKLKKAIEELKKRSKNAKRNQKNSQNAREAAREMMEKMTPEERKKFQEWAEELKRENDKKEQRGLTNSGRSPHDPGEKDVTQRDPLNNKFDNKDKLDLRDPDKDQKTIAEWLSDESGKNDPKRTDKTGGGTVVREARKAAEQAVDESAVPTRYHELIKRFFDKLPDTIDAARKSDKKETDREGDS